MAIDKIGSKALVDCSVAAADIAPGTITATKLAGSITNAKLANSTVTINSTAIALGASGSIDPIAWQSVVVSDGSTVTTMVAGRGYFVNNTSAAGIVKLPISASAGDTVAIKDYAGNFGTNKLTIQRNGHKIQGETNDSLIGTNRASLVLVYIDATKGWLFTNESNVGALGEPQFLAATGGTVTTSGDYKIHTFTGDGNFVVSNAGGGTSAEPSIVDYLVLAGGGGGGGSLGSGAGAGGYRESKAAASPTHTISPHTGSPLVSSTGITVTQTTFPITVGGGGAGVGAPCGTQAPGAVGSNSVFSTITSTGGGYGAGGNPPQGISNGGSGGGAGGYGTPTTGGTGNTPPVSPSQGNNGGNSAAGGPPYGSAGGGGAGAAGANIPGSGQDGSVGGNGVASSITGSSVTRGGGGGGSPYGSASATLAGGTGGGGKGSNPAADPGTIAEMSGTANLGGGGGGTGEIPKSIAGGTGGKGVVILRYKFQ